MKITHTLPRGAPVENVNGDDETYTHTESERDNRPDADGGLYSHRL